MKIYAIIGTTASGKSYIAHKLAKELDCVILSLDSLCIYEQIDVISAKVSKEELNEVKYFGIDLLKPYMDFNVAMFFNEFKNAKEYCLKHNKNLIICGGSSFYLKALMDGLSPKIEEIEPNISLTEIYNLKTQIDPSSNIEKNDKFRLIKWYSIYKNTNSIPSSWLKENKQDALLKDVTIFNLCWDKDILNERIQKRTQEMILNNAILEVETLYNQYGKTKSLSCIGANEIIDYLEGKINKDELIELIAIHTRQLAKRQRTFNKKFDSINYFIKNEDELLQAYSSIKSYINKN